MLALTTSYHTEKNLQKEKSLYKFIWVRQGSITLEIDHQEVTLAENEVISLSNLQHLEFLSIDGEYLTVLFNSNFYCIYGNDHEVSCSGFLFNGSSHVVRFMLNESERRSMEDVVGLLDREFTVSDNLQEEMLRILLKRFIIQSTRIARQRLNITQEKEYSFEIIRQYYNLVDEHFRTKKQVQDYADMLHKSPKTLSNIFSSCKLPSPLRVIHERVEAEAKRLLLYSNKSSKEIADILGFEDQSSFSRFFKNMTGESPVQYRNSVEGKNLQFIRRYCYFPPMGKTGSLHQKVKPIKRNSMKEKFITLLTVASGLKGFGLKFIRVAILVVFVWIGGLKYFHYEADGIVPFVANSPFMSFFYAKDAPEYKEHKNPEGAYVPANREWHEANRTYTFSYGLGALIMSIGILVFLGIFFPKVALIGDTLAIIMTLGTLSFLVTTPEVWVPNLGSGEYGFPLLSGAGRLVIKDIVILASAVTLLSDSSQRVLNSLKKADWEKRNK